MTENEKLLSISNSLLADGDLEITIAKSPVIFTELIDQKLMLVCENGNLYPAELVNLSEVLGI